MPPVPNVILASPGRVQPWPTSDACWSPAMPAIGGAPGSGGGLGRPIAGRVDRPVGQATDVRDAQARRGPVSGSQPEPSLADEPGDAGVGGVGDVGPALGEVPGDPGVDGAEGQVPRCGRSRRCRAGRRAWWPRRWAPAGCPGPAASGRCRPCAGPASRCPARPVRRSPGPTRWSTPAGWRCPPPRPGRPRPGPGGPRQGGVGHGGGVELDQPGRRRRRAASRR